MKLHAFINALPVFIAVAAASGYYYYSQNTPSSEAEMACLSAVIPSVVLHYQQEEIVQLLHDMAKEEYHGLPEKLESESIKPIFSQRADKELLKIAELFQQNLSNTMMEDANVMGAVKNAVSYFKSDAPDFLNPCLDQLEQAKTDCGTIENPNASQQQCLEKHSTKINEFLRKYTHRK